MGDKFKIHYFNARGGAEPARLILSYAGADWEDVRFAEMPADVRARAPYGQVPLLEYNGEIIAQSQTINRFLARKFNLAGANELEAAQCDEVVDAAKDLMLLWRAVAVETDEGKKREVAKKAEADSRTRYLSKFNDILEANGGHFVGKGLTWADIYCAYLIYAIENRVSFSIPDDYPALKALSETVFNAPGIKEWIAKRPVTDK